MTSLLHAPPAWRRQAPLMRASLLVLLGALILLVPTLLNGFPFLFQDSSDYLIFTPRLYRSPFYGLFIFFFHLNRFVWAPVIAQAVITSHLIYVLTKLHRRLNRDFLVLIAMMAAFTSLPFFVGFIMPDLQTALMFIVMYLIAFHVLDFAPPMRLYLLALACVATAAHLSNLTLALLVVWLFIPMLLWCGRSWASVRTHMALLLLPIVLTASAYLLYNSVIFKSFSLSPSGQSFLMANLIEYGPGRAYLEEACPDAGYKICPYVARLPNTANELLWNKGIFDQLGGFAGMEDESKKIVAATIEREPGAVASMAARNFLTALTTHRPAAELTPAAFPPWSSIFDVLTQKFGPRAAADFKASAQMRDVLPHCLIESLDAILVPISFLATLILGYVAARLRRREWASFCFFVIVAVLANTFICAAISGVHDRYQARVTWLLPMTALLTAAALAKTTDIRPWFKALPLWRLLPISRRKPARTDPSAI